MRISHAINCAVLIIVSSLVVSEGFAQFEQFIDKSPLAPSWMTSDQLPLFKKWLEREIATSKDPGRTEGLIATLAYAQLCSNESKAAKTSLSKLSEKRSDRTLLIVARILKTEDSCHQLDQIQKGSKWHVESLLQRADILLSLGKIDEAEAIVGDIPDSSVFKRFFNSRLFYMQGQFADAEQEAKSQIAICESGPTDDADGMYKLLIDIQTKRKDLAQVITTCEKGLLKFPKSIAIRYAMVRTMCFQGQAKDALKVARSMHHDMPDTVFASSAMGIVYYNLGNFNGGLPYLEKAYSFAPSDFQIASAYAMTLMCLGQNEKADLIAERYIHEMGEKGSRDLKQDWIFLRAVNQCYSKKYTEEYKRSLKATLLEGIESKRRSQATQVFACGALYQMGETGLAEKLLKDILPTTDFSKAMRYLETVGTVVEDKKLSD